MTANSARDALKILDTQPCDLVLSDVNMPGQDGFFILGEVKRRCDSVPVVLMSGTPLNSKASAAGPDGFLLKPFPLQQLAETIRTVALAKRDILGTQLDVRA